MSEDAKILSEINISLKSLVEMLKSERCTKCFKSINFIKNLDRTIGLCKGCKILICDECGMCSSCINFLCDSCAYNYRDKIFCKDCYDD